MLYNRECKNFILHVNIKRLLYSSFVFFIMKWNTCSFTLYKQTSVYTLINVCSYNISIPEPIGWMRPHTPPVLSLIFILSTRRRTASGLKSTSPSKARMNVFSAYEGNVHLAVFTNDLERIIADSHIGFNHKIEILIYVTLLLFHLLFISKVDNYHFM